VGRAQGLGWKPGEQFLAQEQDAAWIARGGEVPFAQGRIWMFESALKKVVQNGQFALGQDESAPILSCLAFLFTPSQFEQQGTGLQTWNYRLFN
jgi:hypothetical protein